MARIDLSKITSVTLYTGENGKLACTCRCPTCSQTTRQSSYHGTIEQAKEMFESLPNMKSLYIFGNPDPSVDTAYCNLVMRMAVDRGIRVSTSTSGVGGIKTLKTLLKNIPPEMVDFISFSFDHYTKEGMSYYKGIDYPFKSALMALDWAWEEGYTTKVQPTLWSSNYDIVEKLIDFYVLRGVRWFTFHIGSLESCIYIYTHNHLTIEQLKSVHEQIQRSIDSGYKRIKVRCPDFFYSLEDGKYYCMHVEDCTELLLIFTANGIKATHAPIASSYTNKLSWILGKEPPEVPCFKFSKICPYSERLTNGQKTQCRFLSKYWNYPD